MSVLAEESSLRAQSLPEADDPAVPSEGNRSEAWLRRAGLAVASAIDWLFGTLSLVLGLAAFSVIPVLNLVSLGYLLRSSAVVATTGRIRDGFVGVRKASRCGQVILGLWLVLLPVRLIASLAADAAIIEPGGPGAESWRIGLVVVSLLAAAHIWWACWRGGRLRHFLWPAPIRFVRWLRNEREPLAPARSAIRALKGLRLPHYFWLGCRGFFGALIWLLPPTGLLIAAAFLPPGAAALLSLIGALALGWVSVKIPFLQTRFAMENRWRAMLEPVPVKELFARAPIGFVFAFFILVLFSMPLYLLKIELTPREVAWLPSLLFVVFIFPARLLTGWTVHRALKREAPRHGILRWLGRFGFIPVAAAYTLFLYLTQYLSWHGAWSLLEQHAFLVPAPLW